MQQRLCRRAATGGGGAASGRASGRWLAAAALAGGLLGNVASAAAQADADAFPAAAQVAGGTLDGATSPVVASVAEGVQSAGAATAEGAPGGALGAGAQDGGPVGPNGRDPLRAASGRDGCDLLAEEAQGLDDVTLQSAYDVRPVRLHRRPFDLDAVLGQDAEADAVAAATRRLAAGDAMAAQNALGAAKGPAASLVQARIDLHVGSPRAALAALTRAASDGNLRPWITLERGRAFLQLGDPATAVALLRPLVRAQRPLAQAAVVPLAQAEAAADPAGLLAAWEARLEARDAGDKEARSLLLAARADAEARLGQAEASRATRLRQYLEEPVAKATPKTVPDGVALAPVQALRRIDRLMEAHRNELAAKALDELDALLPPEALERTLACRRAYARGVVARKRHRYAEAEAALGWVKDGCPNDDLVRKAAFTQAKVVSIQDGLRALPLIEAFAARYPTHSMTDDVLFWAGDSLQRRGRNEEAAAYYRRIVALPKPDDQCSEASWRLAWMAYRGGDGPLARKLLQQNLRGRCPTTPASQARARYWLGRLEEDARRPAAAKVHYEAALQLQPLSFYAQQALPRLLRLQRPAQRRATLRAWRRPNAGPAPSLCPGELPKHPAFGRGLYLLGRGLSQDALRELRTLKVDGPAPRNMTPLRRCGPGQTALLFAQLLARAGGHKEAHAKLLGDFAGVLLREPTQATLPVWEAAYPLAFRPAIAAAEAESQLPTYLLQALSREESRFDPEVVSWAEAIGLTQLLLSSGQMAGRALVPKVAVSDPGELFDPQRNARLGGALLALYARKLGGSWPLALAAYNGGLGTAQSWHERFGGQQLAIFAEEMTILETRCYVQRVLQTFGIYRWLYGEGPYAPAVADTLPAFHRKAAQLPHLR